MAKHCAFFFDRNGTLIDYVGYIKQSFEVYFCTFSFEAQSLLHEHLPFFIITKQSSITKEFTTENEVSEVNKYVIKTLKDQDNIIYNIFCCSQKNENYCECKKSKTYFTDKPNQLYHSDLKRLFSIDDYNSYVQYRFNDSITPFISLTEYGEKHQNEIVRNHVIYSNLLEASKCIILNNNQT